MLVVFGGLFPIIEGHGHGAACGRNAAHAVERDSLAAKAIDANGNPFDWLVSLGCRCKSSAHAPVGREAWALHFGAKERRSARAPSSCRGRCSSLNTLLAMAHAIRRHERVTLGTADNMRTRGIAGRYYAFGHVAGLLARKKALLR
jgi:hypothetical protein